MSVAEGATLTPVAALGTVAGQPVAPRVVAGSARLGGGDERPPVRFAVSVKRSRPFGLSLALAWVYIRCRPRE